MLLFIYLLPLLFVTLTSFSVWLIWAVLNFKYSAESAANKTGRFWRLTNLICFLTITFLIIYNTLIIRNVDTYRVELIPFYSFTVADTEPEMLRQLFMNVVMFLPFGMSLACVLRKELSPAVRLAAVTGAGAVFSLLIELTQYFCRLGEAWTDDVLCNAFGAFWGALVLVIPKVFKKN